ncbi:MAG: enhanced serine sensitivity protein SseB [Streptomyces sp.]|nr:enhanced serine sensitivity protein SseB [Streptomyces sp.]
MTFPHNDLEVVLVAASRNETTTVAFVELLFRSTAFFPTTIDGSGRGSLSLISSEQADNVPVFTSLDEAEAAMAGWAFVQAPVREFMEGVPAHLGLAVNPSGTLGLMIPAEAVQHQLTRATMIPVGTTIRLGEPAVEPTELLEAIRIALAAVPAVRQARRVWAQVGDAEPGLVVGLDVDPDNPGVRQEAIGAVTTAHESRPSDYEVNVVFANDRSDFMQWMNERSAPFYPEPA